jgi:hypothetical protein
MASTSVITDSKEQAACARDYSGACLSPGGGELDVEVKEEFVRMRPQFDRVDFVLDFIVDPHVDRVLRKHLAL